MIRADVKKFTSRMLGANTYLLYSGNDCVIIDPCVKPETMEAFISEKNIVPKEILVTHSHIDHILYVNETRDFFGIPAAVHEDDFDAFHDEKRNGSDLFGLKKTIKPAERMLHDGEIINYCSLEIKVILTPGHTYGSVCFYSGNLVFTGDTLFYLSVGRTDLGRGDHDLLMKSLKEKLMLLPDNTIVYPGHGTYTSIMFERESNPFIV